MLKADLATKAASNNIYTAGEQIQAKKIKKFKPATLVKSRRAKIPLKEKSQHDTEAIYKKYDKLIKYIASRIASRLPKHIEIHDMINSGVLGLLDAVEKFDAAKGVKFETYAEYRIKGAMLDSLRAMDWVPRSIRKVASMLETTSTDLEKKLGRPATNDEVAKAMGSWGQNGFIK